MTVYNIVNVYVKQLCNYCRFSTIVGIYYNRTMFCTTNVKHCLIQGFTPKLIIIGVKP